MPETPSPHLLFLALLFAFFLLLAPGLAHAQTGMDQPYFRVTVEDAEQAVAAALQEADAGKHVQVSVLGKRGQDLFHAAGPVTLEVKTLRFDDVSGKWNANLLFRSNQEVISAMPLAGRYQELVELPVMRSRIPGGQAIRTEDVDWIDYPKLRVRSGMITQESELVGKTPKRAISAGRPIRQDELGNAQILKKNALVEMIYRTSSLEIKTAGQAMDPGAEGDMIRVKNLDSKQVVQGMVEASGQVRVMPVMHETALLQEPAHAR